MIKGLIIGVLIWGNFIFHPFHVSICDIKYDAPSRSLQITHRIFVDDLQSVWQEADGVAHLFGNEAQTEQLDSLLNHYIEEHFTVIINNKMQQIKYLGHEIEENVIWVYLEGVKVKRPQLIKVKNSILLEMFEDQTNFVHVNYLDKIKSLQLTPNNDTGEVAFDK